MALNGTFDNFCFAIDKRYRIRYNTIYGGIAMTIDEIIKSIRSEIAISQETLARDLNVSFTSLNRWENRKSKPSRLAIIQLKDYALRNKVSQEILTALERIRI
jgi:DNA-binding transcriptional regulator YiaG